MFVVVTTFIAIGVAPRVRRVSRNYTPKVDKLKKIGRASCEARE